MTGLLLRNLRIYVTIIQKPYYLANIPIVVIQIKFRNSNPDTALNNFLLRRDLGLTDHIHYGLVDLNS